MIRNSHLAQTRPRIPAMTLTLVLCLLPWTQAGIADPIASAQAEDCEHWPRPLNPNGLSGDWPEGGPSALDRQFLLAFERETAGDFEAAIGHYRRAAEQARCGCERAHAEAGVQAAEEAAALRDRFGTTARPTQLFYARLQQLTMPLNCVRVR